MQRRMAAKTPVAAPFAEIGKRLKLTRDAMGIQQNAFAAGAGIPANTYNQYETGKFRPQIDNAIKLCSTYNLTLDWIYLGDPGGLRYEVATAIRALQLARR
jgi:transcriptional regulator with XRE-family HTH domain